MKTCKIGVLALQGAFDLHARHLEATGAKYCKVTTAADLQKVDGLILPGGESRVMLQLLEALALTEPLVDFVIHKPTWGICAGAILLAKQVTGPDQPSLDAIDIDIARNAYGRQLASTVEVINNYRVAYIRAPKIGRVGGNLNVQWWKDGDPTWVESGNIIVTTFHPEVTNIWPSPWHQRFYNLVGSYCATDGSDGTNCGKPF